MVACISIAQKCKVMSARCVHLIYDSGSKCERVVKNNRESENNKWTGSFKMFHCLQDRIPLRIQNTFEPRWIEIVVPTRTERQSAGDLSGFCHQFGAVPHCFELLRHWELPLWNNQEQNLVKGELGSSCDAHTFMQLLTYSSSPCGTRMFISELLALTMSQSSDSLLRYTWQPSVLLMEIVGTLPKTWRSTCSQDGKHSQALI